MRRIVSTVAVAAVLMAGCTGGSGSAPTTSTRSTTPGVTDTPTTPTATVSPIPTLEGFGLAEVRSATFPGSEGDIGTCTAVRVGRHDTYDRVTFDFSGVARPAYRVRYVGEPIEDPSGTTAAVAGSVYLEVVAVGLQIPDPGAQPPRPPSAAELASTVVVQVGMGTIFGGFEGMGQAFIGVSGAQRPFRVLTLTGPSRLVVDIANG